MTLEIRDALIWGRFVTRFLPGPRECLRLRYNGVIFNIIHVGLAIGCCLSFALAQAETGNVRGRVVDDAGAIIPRASVRLHRVGRDEGEMRQETDEEGVFLFSAVRTGLHTLRASSAGINDEFVENIAVKPGTTDDVAVRLGIGCRGFEKISRPSRRDRMRALSSLFRYLLSRPELLSIRRAWVHSDETDVPRIAQLVSEKFGVLKTSGHTKHKDSSIVVGISGIESHRGCASGSLGLSKVTEAGADEEPLLLFLRFDLVAHGKKWNLKVLYEAVE